MRYFQRFIHGQERHEVWTEKNIYHKVIKEIVMAHLRWETGHCKKQNASFVESKKLLVVAGKSELVT